MFPIEIAKIVAQFTCESSIETGRYLARFKNLLTKPKVYLMVPPPLYQDGRYGMNQTVINTLFPGDGPAGVRTLAKAAGLSEPIDLFTLFQKECPVLGGVSSQIICRWL